MFKTPLKTFLPKVSVSPREAESGSIADTRTGLCLYIRRGAQALVAMSVLFCGGLQAFAELGEDGARVLAELNDDDFRVRQSATQSLLADEALTQDDLGRLFEASETPEQLHRLLDISRHRVIREMIGERFKDHPGPGSMGLSHQMVQVSQLGEAARTGVLVVQTLPGFPAYEMLEPGDVIVAFAGQPLADKLTAAQFQQLIRRYKAGEVIDLSVLREDQTIDLLFKLGHGEALREAYDASGMVVNRPYREKWLAARARLLALRIRPTDPTEDKSPEAQRPDPSE